MVLLAQPSGRLTSARDLKASDPRHVKAVTRQGDRGHKGMVTIYEVLLKALGQVS